MSRRVLIFDTSVMCCWLRIPGKEQAGPASDRWDHARVKQLLADEQGSTFVLPLATLIETGNHVAQAPGRRLELANQLAQHLRAVSDGQSPWAVFTEQSALWQPDNLHKLADEWPELAVAGLSIGDATIKDVADYYARSGYEVEIITGDQGLKAYQPPTPPPIPRRRG